jgi:hypothetical protein
VTVTIFSGDEEIFVGGTASTELRQGSPHYVIRVDEDIIRAKAPTRWCVSDPKQSLPALTSLGVPAACIERPTETAGTYLFDTAKAVSGVAGTNAVASSTESPASISDAALLEMSALCAQKQLNVLGFDAGPADGQLGKRSAQASADYTAKFRPEPSMPVLKDLTALGWCLRLARDHEEAAALAKEVEAATVVTFAAVTNPDAPVNVILREGEAVIALKKTELGEAVGKPAHLGSFPYSEAKSMTSFCFQFSGNWQVVNDKGQWFRATCHDQDPTRILIGKPLVVLLNEVRQVE